MKPARMTYIPDSPEGVALALTYMVAQSRPAGDPPPDMIALYRKCLAVVTGPCSAEYRDDLLTRALLN